MLLTKGQDAPDNRSKRPPQIKSNHEQLFIVLAELLSATTSHINCDLLIERAQIYLKDGI